MTEQPIPQDPEPEPTPAPTPDPEPDPEPEPDPTPRVAREAPPDPRLGARDDYTHPPAAPSLRQRMSGTNEDPDARPNDDRDDRDDGA